MHKRGRCCSNSFMRCQSRKVRPRTEGAHYASLTQVEDFASWAKGVQAKQAKLKPHDVPAFTSTDFLSKLDDVRLAFAKVKNKKKPKPPPAPAPAANGARCSLSEWAKVMVFTELDERVKLPRLKESELLDCCP